MPEFYIIFVQKIFSPNFFLWGRGGHLPPAAPVSYAYADVFQPLALETGGSINTIGISFYPSWTTD